jgi:hypothetical protein
LFSGSAHTALTDPGNGICTFSGFWHNQSVADRPSNAEREQLEREVERQRRENERVREERERCSATRTM